MSYQKVGVSGLTSKNIIPEYAREYKREYQFIRLINKEIKYFLDNHDNMNNGLFTTHKVDRIKYFIKRFLRGQEKGKLKDISNFDLDEEEFDNLIEVNNNFRMFYYRHEVVPYPGFDNIYYDFVSFFNKLKINNKYDNFRDYDSESDRECLGYEGQSESDREYEFIDSDSNSDSDSDYVYI